jgi:radical SAM superfamily enzyme YgiQ (UPF0313 family)
LKKQHSGPAEETGAIYKAGDGRLKIALAFPNTYYVGMSNLGFQLVYRQLNRAADVACERVFLQDETTAPGVQQHRTPLCSLESQQPLNSFPVVAFSVSFELDYLNILTMLRQGRIAPLQRERDSYAPLIIGGGIALFLNPEPLADIFDLVIIGEAEEVLEEVLAVLRKERSGTRWIKPALQKFARIDGVYIPSAYQVSYHDNGTIAAFSPQHGFPAVIRRRWVRDLHQVSACSCMSTPGTEFSGMTLVEVSRGCPRRCRFCAAGHVYRPYRIRSAAALQQEIREVPAAGKIGLLGAAVADHPDIERLMGSIAERGGAVSISSLRGDALTEPMVRLLRESGHKTFTIAPEAGSERLRRVLAKDLSNDQLFSAVALLARHRVQYIKLYFLIGLPTEDDDDIEAIADLARRVRDTYFQEAGAQKWLNTIALSVGIFVPKPGTPFQWHPFAERAVLKQRLKMISAGLRKERKITITHEIPKWGFLQALLSRGDRRVGALLIRALESSGDWSSALKNMPLNPDFYVSRARDYAEVLPWDFIDHGTDRKALWQEYRKALSIG